MFAIILESLDRALELDAVFSLLALFDEARDDDGDTVEFVRVAIETLMVDVDVPQVVESETTGTHLLGRVTAKVNVNMGFPSFYCTCGHRLSCMD